MSASCLGVPTFCVDGGATLSRQPTLLTVAAATHKLLYANATTARAAHTPPTAPDTRPGP